MAVTSEKNPAGSLTWVPSAWSSQTQDIRYLARVAFHTSLKPPDLWPKNKVCKETMSLPLLVSLQATAGLQLATYASALETPAPRVGQFCSPPSHFHFVRARRGPANTSGQVQV